MKIFYYLSTCDTCRRILSEVNLAEEIELRDIKSKPLAAEDIDAMYRLSKSYESLFSKRARFYKERNLKKKDLDESDFRNLLLEHYTFLKRPVLIYEDHIFIGNSGKNVSEMKNFLESVG